MTTQLTTRARNTLLKETKDLASKIKAAHTNGEIHTWNDIKVKFGVSPPNNALISSTVSRFVLDAWLDHEFIANCVQRAEAALNKPKEKVARLTLADPADCWQFPNPEYKLWPEQHPAFEKLYDDMFVKNHRLVINNGDTGSGKTGIIIALCHRFIKDGRHLIPGVGLQFPRPIIVITVANALPQTRQKFIDFGLGDYVDSVIFFTSYTSLTTSEGQNIYTKSWVESDPYGELPDKHFIEWIRTNTPCLLILDEAHALSRVDSRRSRALLALKAAVDEQPLFNTRIACFSATLMERVRDIHVLTTLADLDFNGIRLTIDNFNQVFANPIANSRPDLPNAAATERVFSFLAPRITEIPYVKWDYRAVNACKIYDFANDNDKEIYEAAWDEYVKVCELMGKDVDKSSRFTPLTVFRKKAEPLRVEQIVADMVDAVENRGKAAGCCTAFVGTIIKAVFILIDRYGYSPNDIAVVWGGRGNIKPDKILTEDDTRELMQRAIETGDALDAKTIKQIKLNLLWQEDRLLFGDASAADQDDRYARLKAMGLIGVQNLNRRQDQIAKFMSGHARFIFYTLAAGGTGLSLEHRKGTGFPRELRGTPIYAGKEFTQGFGRFPRRNSESDTVQFCCLLRGTIEQTHVAKVLDLKLKSLAKFTSRKTALEDILTDNNIVNLTSNEISKLAAVQAEVRSLEQAIIDANDEESQLHADHDESEGDEE
jgi:hypothetical protein